MWRKNKRCGLTKWVAVFAALGGVGWGIGGVGWGLGGPGGSSYGNSAAAASGTELGIATSSCDPLQIVFLRGSGGTRWTDDNYNAFKDALEQKLSSTEIQREYLDLDYPAAAIGLTNLTEAETMLGAAVSAGEAYAFGASVNAGVDELIRVVNETCPESQFVIGGYSQGAMVISKALPKLKAEKVTFAATFGDPKIYLPEGKGVYPDACRGENLSPYRIYVPDCRAYEGKLGSYRPYQPAGFEGKVGTWCNKHDFFCSPYLSITNHVSYISDDLYAVAAETIFSKIATEFKIADEKTDDERADEVGLAEHDVAFLAAGNINLLQKGFYAPNLSGTAREILKGGGRAALYSYGPRETGWMTDLMVKELCEFDACTPAEFEKQAINSLSWSSGSGLRNYTYAAIKKLLPKLTWREGAMRSLVIYTEDSAEWSLFGTRERDNLEGDEVTELSDVIKIAKEQNIAIYLISYYADVHSFAELAAVTGGETIELYSAGERKSVYEMLMERSAASGLKKSAKVSGALKAVSTPLVRTPGLSASIAADGAGEVGPSLRVTSLARTGEKSATVAFETDAASVLVVLNDGVLGRTTGKEVTVTDLDWSVSNVLTLVPLSETIQGERATVELNGVAGEPSAGYGGEVLTANGVMIPKVPNTGRR